MTDKTVKTERLSKGKKGTEVQTFDVFPKGDARLAKAIIAQKINELIEEKKLEETEAVESLGLTPLEYSNLKDGHSSGMTFDRLFQCLNALNMDVEITIRKHSARSKIPAGIHVTFRS